MVPDHAAHTVTARVGVVVIGRNEGPRLERCLASLDGHPGPIVYVDSGSTDGSPAQASARNISVVELSADEPFTAARGRNAGLARLLADAPHIEFVQFVDGDCEVVAGWLAHAATWLAAHVDVAALCGRLRERHPEASIYNRLCDLEWDRPSGETRACGGIALLRVAALQQVGGYRTDMIAGEEPELCFRLRAAGWRIWRDAADMAWHDAAMTHFGQWWRRALRAGFSYAEGAWLHGASPERYQVRPLLSIIGWAAVLPGLALVPAWPTRGLSLLLLAALPLLATKVAVSERRRGRSRRDAQLSGIFTVVGKFAQLAGLLRWLWLRMIRRPATIIEFKNVGSPTAGTESRRPQGAGGRP